MKTVSQNTPTIYSATTPENNPPQLVASLVPDEQRISFWPQHFGLIPQWVTLEPRVFGYRNTGNLCQPSPVAVRQCSDTGYSAINHRNSTVVLY